MYDGVLHMSLLAYVMDASIRTMAIINNNIMKAVPILRVAWLMCVAVIRGRVWIHMSQASHLTHVTASDLSPKVFCQKTNRSKVLGILYESWVLENWAQLSTLLGRTVGSLTTGPRGPIVHFLSWTVGPRAHLELCVFCCYFLILYESISVCIFDAVFFL